MGSKFIKRKVSPISRWDQRLGRWSGRLGRRSLKSLSGLRRLALFFAPVIPNFIPEIR
ncbi:hypothetical protein HanIR_Chr17g0854531 [Helianthus annuus]|nr:hypothetical protein HanIR_Chr17g0854531 [Helianthus annuus]